MPPPTERHGPKQDGHTMIRYGDCNARPRLGGDAANIDRYLGQIRLINQKGVFVVRTEQLGFDCRSNGIFQDLGYDESQGIRDKGTLEADVARQVDLGGESVCPTACVSNMGHAFLTDVPNMPVATNQDNGGRPTFQLDTSGPPRLVWSWDDARSENCYLRILE